MAVTVTAVVPTVGASPLLGECLRALRGQRLGAAGEAADANKEAAGADGGALEIVLVWQGAADREGPPDAGQPAAGDDLPAGADRVIRLPRNLGFAAATNRGIAEARGPYVATVNDDVVVAPGWLRALVDALEATPGAAAAQGVNLQPTEPGANADRPPDRADQIDWGDRVDGWGLGWNRAAQAVQLGRDQPPPAPEAPPREVFGVSATAAVYRRSALLAVAREPQQPPGGPSDPGGPDGRAAGRAPEVFDTRLESYYEDADLACRLRAAGHTALSVPAARALHAGSLTGGRLGARRWRLLYGNRYAVAAGLLGRGVWRRVPRMAARDLADLGRALVRGDLRKAFGIAGGWGRAARLLPTFAHRGAPGLRPPGRSRQAVALTADGADRTECLDRADRPALSGVVVHWRDAEGLATLVEAWPRDPRFELIVVDNGSGADRNGADLRVELPPDLAGRVIRPSHNLGFAGGANRGADAARGDVILLLNPDAVPVPGALEALLDGFAAHPEAAGLAPRLEDGPESGQADGARGGPSQHRWQLGRLPSPGRLVLEGLFLPARGGPEDEPPAGTPVEQPAAAALALRREEWQDVGGMDPGFYPAWFEDVDLARRLRSVGALLLYWPAARFRHGLGSTVPRLGYGRFLFIYYRNLTRYLKKHHGTGWAGAARIVLPVGMLLRLALLPARRPRRATGRADAARGLVAVLAGALSGWRLPRDLAAATRPRFDRREETRRDGPEGPAGGAP